MIHEYLSPLANHLWQSTVIAGLAALLALALRKNSARIRYGLWLLAATKFLIPFSLLVTIGDQFEWKAPPAVTQRPVSAVAEISMPFVVMPVVTAPPPTALKANPLPAFLLFVWLFGFAISIWFWMRSWWHVHAALRAATPSNVDLPENNISVRVMSCPSLIEPAVFGIFKPVLLLPDGIADRLTRDQLKSILIHELCHIRRRDNLATAVYMVVETLFWFYPLVRWIGKRLMDERERACDEEVLRVGSKPDIYVEGILKVCQFYLESSPTCAAGVMGSNFKMRVEAILQNRVPANLKFGKRLFLAGAGAAVVVLPILLGVLGAKSVAAASAQSQALPDWQKAAGGKMSFEVVSVKPANPGSGKANFPLDNSDSLSRPGTGEFQDPHGRLVAEVQLSSYIPFAYKLFLSPDQRGAMFANVPKWVTTDKYAINAEAEGDPTKDQMRLMMQSLLADRFKLAVHFERQETAALALVLDNAGKTGAKLYAHSKGPACGNGDLPSDLFPRVCDQVIATVKPGNSVLMGGRNMTMAQIVAYLSTAAPSGRPLVDQTGLDGRFDFTFEYTPEPRNSAAAPEAQTEIPGTTFLQALQDQLGLKMKSTKVFMETLVIDHVERPIPN